jgi:hypothetical protein
MCSAELNSPIDPTLERDVSAVEELASNSSLRRVLCHDAVSHRYLTPALHASLTGFVRRTIFSSAERSGRQAKKARVIGGHRSV